MKTYEQVAEEIKNGTTKFGFVVRCLREMTNGKISRDFESHCLVALGIDKKAAFLPAPMGNKAFNEISRWIADRAEDFEVDGILEFDPIQVGLWRVNEG